MSGGMGGMNDSSFGSTRTDDLSSGNAGYGGMKGDEFGTESRNRDEFNSGNDFENTNRKPTMGDKVKGRFISLYSYSSAI
jgi:hypothetical protein